jgi:hypothetical protein
MTRKLAALAALCLLAFSTPAFAEEPGSPLRSIVPQAGFFVGLGGSYNSVKVDQDIGGNATSQLLSGSTLLASGEAGGPAASFHDTQSNLAPDGQLGYRPRQARQLRACDLAGVHRVDQQGVLTARLITVVSAG